MISGAGVVSDSVDNLQRLGFRFINLGGELFGSEKLTELGREGALAQAGEFQMARDEGAIDASHILGSRSAAHLVGSSSDERLELQALTNVEHPHALGPIELVTREACHVAAQCADIHRHLARRLDRVNEQRDAPLAGQS
ncbi:hypothetical protein LCGC14_0855850, partial [marine sediment metagenome]